MLVIVSYIALAEGISLLLTISAIVFLCKDDRKNTKIKVKTASMYGNTTKMLNAKDGFKTLIRDYIHCIKKLGVRDEEIITFVESVLTQFPKDEINVNSVKTEEKNNSLDREGFVW